MTLQLNKIKRLFLMAGLFVTLAMPTFIASASPINCADATTAEELLTCVENGGNDPNSNGSGSGGSGGPI